MFGHQPKLSTGGESRIRTHGPVSRPPDFKSGAIDQLYHLSICLFVLTRSGRHPWRSPYTSMYVSIWLSNHFSSYWIYYSVTNRTVRNVRDSNPWASPWQGDMITNFTNTPFCGPGGVWSPDLDIMSVLLYQLSYKSNFALPEGHDPPTSKLTVLRSTNWAKEAYLILTHLKLHLRVMHWLTKSSLS